MKKRICPICDQEMKYPHYCPTCRQWIREPWVREINYYLNERHPADETECSYHGISGKQTAGQYHPSRTAENSGRTIPQRTLTERKSGGSPHRSYEAASAQKSPQTKKKKSILWTVLKVIGILWLINLVFALVSGFLYLFF